MKVQDELILFDCAPPYIPEDDDVREPGKRTDPKEPADPKELEVPAIRSGEPAGVLEEPAGEPAGEPAENRQVPTRSNKISFFFRSSKDNKAKE